MKIVQVKINNCIESHMIYDNLQTICGFEYYHHQTALMSDVKIMHGKITCKKCIEIIKMCKKVDSRNLQMV